MAKATINSVHSASYAQLLTLLQQIAGNIAFEKGNVTSAYKALIGELGKTTGDNPVDHTVVSYIAAKIAEVNGAADALEERVEANEAAIELLNGDSTKTGSVDQKINAAFNDFATKVSDNQVVDTFKEMVDYVAAHKTEYTNLGALVGTIPADATSTTVVAYAKEVADAAEQNAKNYADGLAGNYDAAGSAATAEQNAKTYADGIVGAEKTRAEGAEGALSGRLDAIEATADQTKDSASIKGAKLYADSLAVNYDAAGSASAVQGATENTVKDIEDAINGFSYLTDEEMTALKALFPTSAE